MVTSQKKLSVNPIVTGPKIPDTSTWLTRYEASDMLRVSGQTLANYERRGLLHPQRAYRADYRGAEHLVVVYDPHELKKLPRYGSSASPRDPGEIAARAFELFREGKSEEEVVVELRSSPEMIEQLHEKWKDMGGAELVISPGAKETLEKIVGSFKSVADLIERMKSFKLTPAS